MNASPSNSPRPRLAIRDSTPGRSYTLGQMDIHEYEQLINKLDTEIEEARKSAELQRRREDLERRARILRDQIEGLQTRRSMLVQLGRPDLVAQIDPVLAQQQQEAADIRAALVALGPAPGGEEALKEALGAPRIDLPPPPSIDPSARAETMSLIDEIEAGKAPLADVSVDERAAQVRVWALRWRTLAERIGQGIARNDPAMRKAYAVIMETRERYPGLPFIEALDPRRHGDWERELEIARKELPLARERARRHKEIEEALERLRAVPSRYHLPEDPEGVRALREAVRACVPHIPLRERLIETVSPWRALLEEDFPFLWKTEAPKPEAEAKPREQVSNRELLVRILNRMLLKKEIGGKHTSFENIYQVADGHDLGRAREGAELLVKQGVLMTKPQQKDRHVSIDPEWTHAVKRFVEGNELGNAAIDRWCAAQNSQKSEARSQKPEERGTDY